MNIEDYIKEKLNNKSLTPFSAEKVGKVLANQGLIGEEVTTWSIDEDGNEIKEKVEIVTLDKETNLPSWIITKADMYGEAVIDKNGHYDTRVISDTEFKNKYEPDSNKDMLYIPKSNIQLFVKIYDDIVLNKDGKDIKLLNGDYINITNDDDIYIVTQKEFEDSYIRSDELIQDEEVHEQKIYHS